MSAPGLLGVWKNLQGRNSIFMRNSWSKEILKNEEAYKMYENWFEKLKKQSKILCFKNKLKKCENNIKNTWNPSLENLEYKMILFPKV